MRGGEGSAGEGSGREGRGGKGSERKVNAEEGGYDEPYLVIC